MMDDIVQRKIVCCTTYNTCLIQGASEIVDQNLPIYSWIIFRMNFLMIKILKHAILIFLNYKEIKIKKTEVN